MKALTAIFALLFCVSATPGHRPVFAGMPPLRFQSDSYGVVVYVSDIAPYCGVAEPGYTILACHRTIKGVSVTFLPNPCIYGMIGEHYATLACHEAGHRLGWGANHEE